MSVDLESLVGSVRGSLDTGLFMGGLPGRGVWMRGL